ncbi:undecaprenyl-diphosphatase [Halorhodospira halochloris]|uniref:Undecaprenyl-diphosphatase n=1 Tax=Halorhodospira halochloris TaxID=1052 RepID=A0A120MZI8_HALHR|nr:undecaprenyl-diphosphate phosphatase [Halorhodospira halochloris]MBK1651583.1 UDP-diphosphatase [Halorhodospira halochloris]BAU57148.1 undecaprenyl-diphosphatase [Halorhodospira halochloris]
MAIWIAVLLGIVQGVFMFLPVSSTAHMVLLEHWLIGQGHSLPAPDSAEMLLFNLVVHVGTLISIAVVFWPSLRRFTGEVIQQGYQWASAGKFQGPPLFARLFLLGMLSVLFTGIVGLSLKAFFEHAFATPSMVAAALIVTGALLFITDKLPRRRRSLKKTGIGTATIIGVAQGFALMPGISRSAMTIIFGLFAGLKRRWAAEYSFFLAIPTICAATLLHAIDVYRLGGLGEVSITALLVGFVVAAIVGIISLKLVVYFLYRAQLKIFSFYVWILAAAILTGLIDIPAAKLG